MLNKEIFIKRTPPPHYTECTKIASFTQISQQRFVIRLTVPLCSIHLQFALFLSLCFLPLRHQVVWDRYMGVIKSCIFKMYHDWSVFLRGLPPSSPLFTLGLFSVCPPLLKPLYLPFRLSFLCFQFISSDVLGFSSPIITFSLPVCTLSICKFGLQIKWTNLHQKSFCFMLLFYLLCYMEDVLSFPHTKDRIYWFCEC